MARRFESCWVVYEAIDKDPTGAGYKLIPHGMHPETEGAFYCDEGDIDQAYQEAKRFNKETHGREADVDIIRLH